MLNQNYQQLSDLKRVHAELERDKYSDQKKAEYQAKKARKRALGDAMFNAVLAGYRSANNES